MNQGSDAPSLTFLIERILRFERHLERFMPVLDEGEAIGLLDGFALQRRVPNGKTVLDQFLASWPDLTAADREMLRGWRDPVEGIFFGSDEPVLTPAEAEERFNAYYRHRQEAALARHPERRRPRKAPGMDVPAFELPPDLADADTIGIIYDETDGLNFYNDYGILGDLFAHPALAADKRYADVLRGYLRSETIAPLPFRRLAAAHPQTIDAVFRRVPRKPDFSWAEHGEALLRQRKPWYYEREPRPGISVIGIRLSELAAGL